MTCGIHLHCGEILLRLLIIGLSNGAIIALNALGLTLVYSVIRTINFAYGDLFSLTSVVVASTLLALGVQHASLGSGLLALVIALVVGVGAAASLNVAIEQLAFKPFRGRSRTAPLIATIGISFMLYQAALLLRTFTNQVIPGEHRSVPGIPELPRFRLPELIPALDLVKVAGLSIDVVYPLKDFLLVIFAVVVCLLTRWLLGHTSTGRALRACAQDPEMAQLCGVNRDGTIRLVFALGGGLAGLAAWAFTVYYTHPYTLYGVHSGLIAFTAAILGGIGRPAGALLSGLLLGVLAALSDYFLATQWTPVLIMGVLILLLIVRPTGLGNEAHTEEIANPSLTDSARRTAPRQLRSLRWLNAGLLLLALAYPWLNSAFDLRFQVGMTNLLIFALLALGLNLVLGVAGQLDLGFAAYFAVGAYTTGLLTSPASRMPTLDPGPLQFGLAVALSGGAAALVGAFNGLLTSRLRGDYLAIVTLALGQIISHLLLNLDQITNGIRGLAGIPRPLLGAHRLIDPIEQYGLVVVFVGVLGLLCHNLIASHTGRAWAALSMDEVAAASTGVPPTRTRTTAFMLGAALAGVAGGLFASIFGYISPALAEFRISALVIAMVVIGGSRSITATIISALLVAGYDQVIIPRLGALLEQWSLAGQLDLREFNFLTFGLALYLTVLIRGRQR